MNLESIGILVDIQQAHREIAFGGGACSTCSRVRLAVARSIVPNQRLWRS